MCWPVGSSPRPGLIHSVNGEQYCDDKEWIVECVFLAPTLEVVYELNEEITAMFPGEDRTYKSADSIDI